MLSEENEIALVVKRYCTTAVKLWIVRKQRGKYPRKHPTEPRVEVVQNHLGQM